MSFLAVIIGILAIDQLSKWIIAHTHASFQLSFLHIVASHNTAAAFSLPFPNVISILAAVAILIALSLILLLFHRHIPQPWHWLVSLIIAGGLSNLLERLALGRVTDIIELDTSLLFSVKLSWLKLDKVGLQLNLADLAIVFGVFALGILAARTWRKHNAARQEQANIL